MCRRHILFDLGGVDGTGNQEQKLVEILASSELNGADLQQGNHVGTII